MAELGYSKSPAEVLSLLRKNKRITLEFLNGYDTCESFTLGKLLGEGKTGSVFEIEDDDNKGLPVVLKEFTMKDTAKIIDDIHVLPSALNDIMMSSIFHSFYDGKIDYCISFPYYEGFFTCGNTGYSIVEQLGATFSKYFSSADFNLKTFRIILFQILYGIRFMIKNRIVHNDMHAKNVMIRSSRGISYKGIDLDDVKTFCYVDGSKTYYHDNVGVIGKIVDFDFAAKYSPPQVVAKKVYDRQDDEWNLTFRESSSYDMLTFVSYMVYYTTIKTPGAGKLSTKDLNEVRSIVYELADYIVDEVETTVGDIKDKGHYNEESDGRARKRDSVSKLMDMVSVPSYRPQEKYCHLKLDKILDIKGFKSFKNHASGSFVVGHM